MLPNHAQDVYKDAGLSVLFSTFQMNRKDADAEREAMAEAIGRTLAIKRSMNIRMPDGNLRIALGFSHAGWTYLFPEQNLPKELEPFEEIKGDTFTAIHTPADVFLHVRAKDEAIVYEVMDQIMTYLRPITTLVDETKGFHYFEGRAIIGFIDGTENPVDDEAVEWGIIGDEDPEFVGGSYAFAQKYVHNMDAWKALTTEQQEAFIGRRKFSDLELDDDEKDERAHNIIAQDNRNGEEHKIVRMNVPFSNPAKGETGTYFIGYARYWDVTKQMLTNMFTQNDRLLEFSTPVTGEMFFIPSLTTLDELGGDD